VRFNFFLSKFCFVFFNSFFFFYFKMSDPSGVSAYISHLDRAVDRARTGPKPVTWKGKRGGGEVVLCSEKNSSSHHPNTFLFSHLGIPVGGTDHIVPSYTGLTCIARDEDVEHRRKGKRHFPMQQQ
jgi:hypothetical protein